MHAIAMNYDLKALRSSTDIVSITLDALDERDAIAQAKSKGYVVLSARPQRSWRALLPYKGKAAFPLLLFMIGGPTLTPAKMQEYATVFDGITGTLSAIVMALLIARADSKLSDYPTGPLRCCLLTRRFSRYSWPLR